MCVCVCVCVCVCKSTPRTADVTITKIAGYVRVIFLAFIVFTYGHFVEYMNMHAMNMQLTAVVGAASVT